MAQSSIFFFQELCSSENAHLAMIETAEENTFLTDFITRLFKNNKFALTKLTFFAQWTIPSLLTGRVHFSFKGCLVYIFNFIIFISPTEGNGDILFLVRIVLALALALSSASASA